VREAAVSVAALARAGRATELQGIGDTLQEKILALLDTGTIPATERLRAKFPAGLIAITRLPGLGPKRARLLHSELGIDSPQSLRDAALAQRLRGVRGLGPKFEAGVLAALDRVCKPDCLIATNTSTIPISTLAAVLPNARRGRFIGTHYFSPVSRMKLVEIIPAFETSETAVETAMRLCRGAGKTPIRVKDVVGFAVNRVLHAFIIEAIKLVEEGVASPADIDTACRLGLGHPMGPFELMDATTTSLSLQVQEILFEAYGERFRPPALLKQKVKAGYIGKKAGKGWRTEDKQ